MILAHMRPAARVELRQPIRVGVVTCLESSPLLLSASFISIQTLGNTVHTGGARCKGRRHDGCTAASHLNPGSPGFWWRGPAVRAKGVSLVGTVV